ncbi:MAG: L-rhamnose mutarotase [Capnocytophaga felis]|nr:L-rhamnose mutarotase [Capnocytophaga felis]
MKRFGQVIRIKPEKLAYYRQLHANPWKSVLDKIRECNIRNYSIFLLNDELLFAYFEYVGDNFEEDMQKMAADPETQRWWAETDPCQQPLELKEGEWWHTMEQIFYTE